MMRINSIYKMKFILFILVLCFSVFGQKKSVKKSTVAQNTILYKVLKDLAPLNICGIPKPDGKEIIIGKIVKRSFNDSEIALNGFVLSDAKDRRTLINLDDEYIAGRAASANSNLSDFLIKGINIKAFVYRCGRLY